MNKDDPKYLPAVIQVTAEELRASQNKTPAQIFDEFLDKKLEQYKNTPPLDWGAGL